jgi:hypothetical protein
MARYIIQEDGTSSYPVNAAYDNNYDFHDYNYGDICHNKQRLFPSTALIYCFSLHPSWNDLAMRYEENV